MSTLPIVAYADFDYARDFGHKRNWWRAINVVGEPVPATPGSVEKFVVSGMPPGQTLYVAVRSYDDSSNRSAMSNVVKIKP